ncbi:MAG: transposase, partial [Gemmatimonadales bacterium]
LGKFLLRQGRRRPARMTAWTQRYRAWLGTQHFAEPAQEATCVDYLHEVDHAADRIRRLETAIDTAVAATPVAMRAVIAALQTLRGIKQLTAATIVCEVGTLTRFAHPRQLMGYSGTVPREHSSGSRVRRGAITKTGNAHLRRVLVEAAWAYRHGPSCTGNLKQRQAGQPAAITALAWKAQHRLCARYRRLVARGKSKQHVVTVIARELVGFLWAIGVETERGREAAHRAAA